ncbi:MAG TPA: hypothetical protein VFE61_20065 [Candidatus Sulfotelmatobacter sp.]|nr:hypothetical protein [Candidatus Sulfotelmatobacter sp.]
MTRSADEATDTSANADRIPRLPKVPHRLAIRTGEDIVFRLLSDDARTQQRENFLGHADGPALTILGRTDFEPNDAVPQIDLEYPHRQQFTLAKCERVGEAEQGTQPESFLSTFVRQPCVVFVAQKSGADIVFLLHWEVGNDSDLRRSRFQRQMERSFQDRQFSVDGGSGCALIPPMIDVSANSICVDVSRLELRRQGWM